MTTKNEYLDFAYIRGKIVRFEDANVSIATNALQYGGAVFGGIKGYRQDDGSLGVLRLDDHIKRLLDSAKILRFPHNFKQEQLAKIFHDLTKKNSPKGNVYFRPFLYRSDINLKPLIKGDYDFALYMMNMGDYFDKSKGMKVCISSWIRNSDTSIPPRTKVSGGYINAALAMHDANEAGYDAAVMLDSTGHVTEGAVMNIYLVKEGKIITPPASADILEGITRKTILDVAKDLGIVVEERQVDRSELYTCDEIFFSGTATEISWVESIDKVLISKKSGPITNQLQDAFDKVTKNNYSKRDYLKII